MSGGWVIARCNGGGEGTWKLDDVTCKRCNGTDKRFRESYRVFVQKVLLKRSQKT